jgi:hypothetical protein
LQLVGLPYDEPENALTGDRPVHTAVERKVAVVAKNKILVIATFE